MDRSGSLGLLLAGALTVFCFETASATPLATSSRAAWSADWQGQADEALPLLQVQASPATGARPSGGGGGGGRAAAGGGGGGRAAAGGGGGGPRFQGGGGGGHRYGGGGGGRRYHGGGGGYDPGAAAAVGIVGAVIGLAAEQAAQDQARREYRQRRYYRQQRYYYED